MEHLNIRKNDRLLIVAPHPDDECIGAGGIILLYPDITDVIVLTDGCIGQNQSSQEQTVIDRRNEFVEEMNFAGISEYSFCNIKDGQLINNLDCLLDVDLSFYTKIFVTGMNDGHTDHMAAYLATKKALEKQELQPEVYLYEVHSSLVCPTHMLNITNVIDKKKQLIEFHKSQLEGFPYDEFAVIMAKYRAMQNRQCDSYYEVFSIDAEQKGIEPNGYETERKLQKYTAFYTLLIKWMEKKNKGSSINDVLKNNGVTTVSIYGFAGLGRLLYEELDASKEVEVKHILDNKDIESDVVVISKPSQVKPDVDAVIVTAITSYADIKQELQEKGYKEIYSLTEVIEQM